MFKKELLILKFKCNGCTGSFYITELKDESPMQAINIARKIHNCQHCKNKDIEVVLSTTTVSFSDDE